MSGEQQYPLALVIKAVDKATGPLREMNAKIKAFTDPLQKLSKDAGFPKLFDAFKGVGSAASKVGDEAGKLITKFFAVGAAAGYAGYEILKSTVDAGDKLAEMAKRVGLSVDAYAQLQFAAGQAHVDQEEFNASMDQFNKRLGEVKAGGGPLLKFLEKVGPGLATQVKGAKNVEQAMGLMANAFESIQDPQRRAALSAATFGKGNLQMGQFLGQGSAKIHELMKRYFEIAGSQEKFAETSEALKKAMNETDAAFNGLRNAAAAELFPALTQLAGVLTTFLASNREGLKAWAQETGKAIEDWVKGGGVDRLIQGFKDFAKTAGEVIDMIGGPKGLAIAFGAFQLAPLAVSVLSLAASFGVLAIALAPYAVIITAVLGPVMVFTGMVLALGLAGKALYDNWEPLKQFFVDLADAIGKAFDKLGGFKGIAGSIATKGVLGTAWDAAGSVGSSLFGNYEDNHKSAFDPSAARPGGASPGGKVLVDFTNLPRNTRVTPGKQNTGLDLSLGYNNFVMQ